MEISAEHSNPALTSEYFSIHVAVENREEREIQDLKLNVAITDQIKVEGQTTGTGSQPQLALISRVISESLLPPSLSLFLSLSLSMN